MVLSYVLESLLIYLSYWFIFLIHSLIHLFLMFTYFWERDRRQRERERKRERETEHPKWALLLTGESPMAGLELTNCEITTWVKVKCLIWLSHPGAPYLSYLVLQWNRFCIQYAVRVKIHFPPIWIASSVDSISLTKEPLFLHYYLVTFVINQVMPMYVWNCFRTPYSVLVDYLSILSLTLDTVLITVAT